MNKGYAKLMEGTKKQLEESRKEDGIYIWNVLGKDFIISPDVFSPKYFKDTEFFAAEVPNHVNGPSFLEIGTGTGIVSHFVYYQSREVKSFTGTDINLEALKIARANAALYGIEDRISIAYSNIYTNLQYRGKFNTIFWNVPFGDWPHDNSDCLEKAVWDPNYTNLEKYISGAREYLHNEKSNLLIGFSTTLGKKEVLDELLEKYNFTPAETLAETTSAEGNPNGEVKFQLFESYWRGEE